jgi:hypothetical protein
VIKEIPIKIGTRLQIKDEDYNGKPKFPDQEITLFFIS